MSGVIVCCGPSRGKRKAYRCACCGTESDSLDSFAMSLCWACSYGANLDCDRCVEAGVWIDKFSFKRGKGHRFQRWCNGSAVTTCGLAIPRDDIGQAMAVRQQCRRCWSDEVDA